MKHLIMFTLLLTGCATHHFIYDTTPNAKTNYAEAHSDCVMKSRIAVGWPQGQYDYGYGGRLAAFTHECMEGQGYVFRQID